LMRALPRSCPFWSSLIENGSEFGSHLIIGPRTHDRCDRVSVTDVRRLRTQSCDPPLALARHDDVAHARWKAAKKMGDFP
jgi:hypothetical protein